MLDNRNNCIGVAQWKRTVSIDTEDGRSKLFSNNILLIIIIIINININININIDINK